MISIILIALILVLIILGFTSAMFNSDFFFEYVAIPLIIFMFIAMFMSAFKLWGTI